MRIHGQRKKNAGMTLAELMVSTGLLSIISLVTLQLYMSAQTEFQYASGNMTLSQRVRTTTDRITQYLKTACPPNPQVSAASPFYHPSFQNEPNREIYEADFVSSICFLRNPAKGVTPWPVTDTTSAAYIGDVSNPRTIYENDVAFTSPVLRYPSLYRYRIAWNPLPTDPYTHKGRTGDRSIPPRAVYVERLTYGESGDPDTPNSGSSTIYPASSGVPLRNFLPDTGTPYANMRRTIITPVAHLVTFNAYDGNVIMLRVRIYNRDPENPGRLTDSLTMTRNGFGGNRINGRERFQYVEMNTNIQIPNLTLK